MKVRLVVIGCAMIMSTILQAAEGKSGLEIHNKEHQTCLSNVEDVGFLYAERNLQHFYEKNKHNINKLCSIGFISKGRRALEESEESEELEESDRLILKAIFESDTNISMDARAYPSDLRRDLENWTDAVFSSEGYEMKSCDSFRTLEDLQKVLYLLSILCKHM